MEEAVSSQWALVIRNDGEASVVPLRDVSALQHDEAVIGDKNPTIIVLQTQEQDELVDGSGLELSACEDISGSDAVTEEAAKHVADFITVSAGREEGAVDPLSITIADTSHHLPPIGPDSLDNIHISVLAPREVTQAIPHKANTHHSVPTTCDTQSLDPPTTAAAADISSGSPRLTSVGYGTDYLTFTPASEDARHSARHWKEREGKEKLKNIDLKVKLDKDSTKKQRKEDFNNKVDVWTQKLACSSELVEPFERLEATLHKDITAELGLALSRNIFISLQQQGGAAQGVRVTETSPNHIVVSGSLVELLASRDVILEEIRKLKGLPKEVVLPSTCDIGVMCELIPSPATTRHASTLGLDRSARRYHSVLSRPLSPEPSPMRRRSKKQLLTHSKARNTDKRHLMKGFTERVAKKRSQSQSHKNVESGIKPKTKKDIFSKHSCHSSQEEDSGISVTMTGVSTEPSGVQTIIVSNQGFADTQTMQTENTSDFDVIGVSKDNCPGTLAAKQGDETKPPETPVHIEVNKHNTCLESLHNECLSVSQPRHKREDESVVVGVKDEMVFVHKQVSKESQQLQETQDSTQVKFKFLCKICSYKSMRENHFLKHMQLHDKGLALYRCSECSFVSIRASHLRRHKMSHAQQVLHCHLCAYTCDDQKLLTKHIRVKHHTPKQPSTSDDLFECEECEYKTSWHYAFQRHRRTHASSKVVVIHSCPQCHYKTVRREHFLRHIKNVHQNYRPFLCDICGKAFKRQDALKQHHVSHYQNLSHGGDSGQVGPYGFVCHICQKVCRSAANLKEHMATHSEERSFLCEVCGASFKTRSVQRNHVQTIHRRPKAFTCASCDKKFNTKFALRRHMKQHDTSIHDMEELQELGRNPRVSGSVGHLCELQAAASPLLPQTTPSMVHIPGRSGSPLSSTPEVVHPQHAPSAYQITIDGQPAFLVPHLDAQHATLQTAETTITKGSGIALVGGEGGGGAELAALTSTQEGASVSVPVVPATVHILNQNTISTSSGDLILSSEHYDGGQGTSLVASDTANYINTQHGN